MLRSIRDAQHALAQGDCSTAEAISARIVRDEPKNTAAWHVLGNALLDAGKTDRAISAFRQALRLNDDLAELHNDLGAAYFEKGWHAQAEACFRKAIEREGLHIVAHANLGASLRAQGRLNDSRRAYQRALFLRLRRLWPFARKDARRAAVPASGAHDGADALHLAAIAAEDQRDYERALQCLRQALERRSDVTEYHITHARILVRLGDHEGALRAASAALELEPGSAPVHATMAGLFHPWREDLAEKAARHALELDPGSDLAHANLAAALWGQGRLAEAEHAAREAIRLNPRDIRYRTNLGLILKDLDRIEEARAVYRELATEAPRDAKLCLDVGTLALETEGDLVTARRMYRTAQQHGDEPRAYMAEALVDFLEGGYERAWPNYEARKKLGDQRDHHRQFDFLPDWDCGAVKEGELLVYGEQGLGDEVMFASMFRDLERRAPGSRLVCDPRLSVLFARSFPALQVIGAPRTAQRAVVTGLAGLRYKVAAGSLGAIFRRTASDFPRHRGYLVPDPSKVDAYRARLEGLPGRRKLGLSWVGGVQTTGRNRRSVALESLLPVLEQSGVAWISLQYTDEVQAMERLRRQAGIEIHDFRGATADMDELASLIQALHAVISVCNTTVHVAGAVGKDTLVMAPFVPEWRYGMRDERMVWYPSAQVFRQSRYGDWDEVVRRVHGKLREAT